MDELPPEEEACVLWRACGNEADEAEKAERKFLFGPADPLRRSRVQPPSISFLPGGGGGDGGLGLAGAGAGAGRLARGGQTRCRQRDMLDMLDMTVVTDRCDSRPPFCTHGWVTISQNSDLDRCLLLPSDPPSRPLPLFAAPAAAAATARPSQEEYGRYCQLIPAPAAWGSHGRCVHDCSRQVPHRNDEPGMGPSETSENKQGTRNPGPLPPTSVHPIPIHPPKPAGAVGLFVPTVRRSGTYLVYFVPPRLPHPCPCLVIFCPALPACVAFPRTRAASMRMIHISSWGSLRRLDSRSPDGGYNNSTTSRTSSPRLAVVDNLLIHPQISRTSLLTGCDCLPSPTQNPPTPTGATPARLTYTSTKQPETGTPAAPT